MSAVEALGQLEALKALVADMEPALKERALLEAVEKGAAVAVRPFSFRMPRKGGECDPWFDMAYHQWMDLKKAGFRGFVSPGNMGSERAALFVVYDRAAAFLRERMEAQSEALAGREQPAHLRKGEA